MAIGSKEAAARSDAALPARQQWVICSCLLIAMAWGPILWLHILTVSTDILTPLDAMTFYRAAITGGVFGLALATIAAIAAWFSPWPRGQSYGTAIGAWLSVTMISAPGYAVIAPPAASRLMEWKAFGWSAPVWKPTSHRVMNFSDRDHNGTHHYSAGIDPYGEWAEVTISKEEFTILHAADRPNRPSDYCVTTLEQEAGGVVRMADTLLSMSGAGARIAPCRSTETMWPASRRQDAGAVEQSTPYRSGCR